MKPVPTSRRWLPVTMALVPNDASDKKRQRRKPSKKRAEAEKEERPPEMNGDDATDDDLDLSGFSASYDLPARKKHER